MTWQTTPLTVSADVYYLAWPVIPQCCCFYGLLPSPSVGSLPVVASRSLQLGTARGERTVARAAGAAVATIGGGCWRGRSSERRALSRSIRNTQPCQSSLSPRARDPSRIPLQPHPLSPSRSSAEGDEGGRLSHSPKTTSPRIDHFVLCIGFSIEKKNYKKNYFVKFNENCVVLGKMHRRGESRCTASELRRPHARYSRGTSVRTDRWRRDASRTLGTIAVQPRS